MKSLKSRTKHQFLIIILSLVYFALTVLTAKFNQMQLASLNGVLMAFEFFTCLLMVLINYRVGFYVSCFLTLFSVCQNLFIIILGHTIAPLPGVFNNIIFLGTLSILSDQFARRDKNAVTDPLTGLSNRRGLNKLLKVRIERNKPFAVVYVDLGNFKMMNDNFGHTYGDMLLKHVTAKITNVIGKNGVATRIGGDEFVLIINDPINAHDITEQVLSVITEKTSIPMDGTEIESYLTAYAGIAQYPFDAKDADSLIKYADIAMYDVVKSKTERIGYFSKEMEHNVMRKLELEKLIKDALINNYFYLVYQPQYKMEGKKLRGFESLLRLKTPDGQFVSPAEFIPIAETCDLIFQIDDYVLNRAMVEFKDIVKNKNPELTISINVSAKNIGSVVFPDKVRKILQDTGFPPQNLEIEITEYCMVQSVEITIENIKKLRAMGIQIALDDFGTGYTSLSYLAKLPINLLKVDKSLVDDIEASEKSREFVNAVISMGHLMGCEVISEGVENQPQLDLLKNQGCDFVQGYIWGKPLDYSVARDLSANN